MTDQLISPPRENPLITSLDKGDDPNLLHVYDEDWTLCGIQLDRYDEKPSRHGKTLCAACLRGALSRAEYYLEEARKWEIFHFDLKALDITQVEEEVA